MSKRRLPPLLPQKLRRRPTLPLRRPRLNARGKRCSRQRRRTWHQHGEPFGNRKATTRLERRRQSGFTQTAAPSSRGNGGNTALSVRMTAQLRGVAAVEAIAAEGMLVLEAATVAPRMTAAAPGGESETRGGVAATAGVAAAAVAAAAAAAAVLSRTGAGGRGGHGRTGRVLAWVAAMTAMTVHQPSAHELTATALRHADHPAMTGMTAGDKTSAMRVLGMSATGKMTAGGGGSRRHGTAAASGRERTRSMGKRGSRIHGQAAVVATESRSRSTGGGMTREGERLATPGLGCSRRGEVAMAAAATMPAAAAAVLATLKRWGRSGDGGAVAGNEARGGRDGGHHHRRRRGPLHRLARLARAAVPPAVAATRAAVSLPPRFSSCCGCFHSCLRVICNARPLNLSSWFREQYAIRHEPAASKLNE